MTKRNRQEEGASPPDDGNGAASARKRRRSDDGPHPAESLMNPKAAASKPKKSFKSKGPVERQIEKGVKELTRALKLAKGFERQKLGKRIKAAAAKKDAALVQRLDAEMQAVKKLENRSDLAQTHLYKRLLRAKTIRESPALPSFVALLPSSRPEKTDAVTLNVTARLYNARPVKEALEEAYQGVRQAMGLLEDAAANDESSAPAGKERPSRPAGAATNAGAAADEQPAVDEFGRQTALRALDFRPLLGDENGLENAEHDYEELDDRVASASEDEFFAVDDDDDDGLSNDATAVQTKEKPRLPSEELYASSSSSPSPPPDPPDSGPDQHSKQAQPSSSSRPQAPNRDNNNYLPALTVGGYVSGSESEPEDVEDFVAPRRRNRRGQRARQLIWEQKYGGEARHLNRSGNGPDRNAGWDARYGAVPAGGGGGKGGGGGGRRRQADGGGGSGGVASGTNRTAVDGARELRGKEGRKKTKKKTHVDGEGALHPSWAAKRKAKEKSQGAAFQGKKISFD